MTNKPKINPSQFRPYLETKGATLLPLGHWTTTFAKCPVSKGWPTRTFEARHTIEHAIRTGNNVGFRPDASWVVVDYDKKRDPSGDQWLGWCIDYGVTPSQFPCVLTGGGGRHLYMRNPTKARVVDRLPGYDAVEYKSGGRQVVAAGSVHPSGRSYRWSKAGPPLKKAPPMPGDLLAAITSAPVSLPALQEPADLDGEQLKRLLAGLDPRAYADRDKWRDISAACHHATNGHGFEVWDEWCARDDRFATAKDDADRTALWRDFDKRKPTKVRTIATIYGALKKADRRDLIPSRQAHIYSEWQKMTAAERHREVVKDFEDDDAR